MDVEDDFRSKVRLWLEANLPEAWADRMVRGNEEPDPAFLRAWAEKLRDGGWMGLSWDTEIGGRGLGVREEAIYLEEMARASAPENLSNTALTYVGPTIRDRGTDEQRARFLPRILSTEDIWCQGFSEPGAGSDLASLETRARLDGDRWLINGQKVWSSYAHLSDRCALLARTGEAGHAGLTMFLLDLHQPGCMVRPLRQITGRSEFCEIFLDDAVVEARDVLGQPGEGWSVAMSLLAHERGTAVVGMAVTLQQHWNHAVELAKELGVLDDPAIRNGLVATWITLQALWLTVRSTLESVAEGMPPGPQAGVTKLRYTEEHQRLTKLCLDMLGPAAASAGAAAPWNGFWQTQTLRSRGDTIGGGTSEIVRSVLAERVLLLPKSR